MSCAPTTESKVGLSCRLSLAELFRRAGLSTVGHDAVPETVITGLTDDSRAVTRGSCFVAVRGSGRDGHGFLKSAIGNGATAVVVQADSGVRSTVPAVRVADTRVALSKLAAAYFDLAPASTQPLRLIGVTGTNGKTTVVWLLRSILNTAGYRTALFGTIEYDLITTRLTADMTTPGPVELCRRLAAARAAGATHAVMEVSSHALDQHRCDGLAFAAGAFTNLTGDHLDYHKSMEAYCKAKRRLFESLSPDSVAVVNADDPMGALMALSTGARVITYGLDADRCEFKGHITDMDRRGTRFVVQMPGSAINLQSPLIGRHNVLNLLAASATAWGLGVDVEAIRAGAEQLQGVPGRLQRAEPDGCSFSVLVDYAHTDDALRNVLTAVRPLTRGRLICVFGCGGDRDRTKRPRMGAVVGSLADVAIVTSDNPRTEDPRAIIDEVLPGFGQQRRCRIDVEVDRRSAIQSAIATAQPGDTVLIAGKGHENYQLIGGKVLPFDDLEVARQCLTKLEAG